MTATVLGITAVDGTAKVAQADCNVADNIDTDNAFAFVRATATCTGGTGTLLALAALAGPSYRQG